MPPDWEKKPITYDLCCKKEDADIVISLEQDVCQTILPIIQKHANETPSHIAIRYGFDPPEKLRKTGWKFSGDEFSGEAALKEPK